MVVYVPWLYLPAICTSRLRMQSSSMPVSSTLTCATLRRIEIELLAATSVRLEIGQPPALRYLIHFRKPPAPPVSTHHALPFFSRC